MPKNSVKSTKSNVEKNEQQNRQADVVQEDADIMAGTNCGFIRKEEDNRL